MSFIESAAAVDCSSSSSKREWQTLDNLTALVIGNCCFWGAGLKVLPDAVSSDGLLDAVVLQSLGLWDFIYHLLSKGRSVLSNSNNRSYGRLSFSSTVGAS